MRNAAASPRRWMARWQPEIPFLSSWIELLEPALEHSAHLHDSDARHLAMERDCIRLSLERLMTFPFIAERVEAGTLTLDGARFGIADGRLELLDRPGTNSSRWISAPWGKQVYCGFGC